MENNIFKSVSLNNKTLEFVHLNEESAKTSQELDSTLEKPEFADFFAKIKLLANDETNLTPFLKRQNSSNLSEKQELSRKVPSCLTKELNLFFDSTLLYLHSIESRSFSQIPNSNFSSTSEHFGILLPQKLPSFPSVRVFNHRLSLESSVPVQNEISFLFLDSISFSPSELEQIHQFNQKFFKFFFKIGIPPLNPSKTSKSSKMKKYFIVPLKDKTVDFTRISAYLSPPKSEKISKFALASNYWVNSQNNSIFKVYNIFPMESPAQNLVFFEVQRYLASTGKLHDETIEEGKAVFTSKYFKNADPAVLSVRELMLDYPSSKERVTQFRSLDAKYNFDFKKVNFIAAGEILQFGFRRDLIIKDKANYSHKKAKKQFEPTLSVYVPAEVLTRFEFSVVEVDLIEQLPSLLLRMERAMLSLDLTQELRLKDQTDLQLLVEATTTENAFETFSYEVLEAIGDSVLKFLVSVKLYSEGYKDEKKMSSIRSKLVSNSNLVKLAQNVQISRFIQASGLKVQSWVPPFFDCREEWNDFVTKKTEADVVEALLAAVTLGQDSFYPAVRLLNRMDLKLKLLKQSLKMPKKPIFNMKFNFNRADGFFTVMESFQTDLENRFRLLEPFLDKNDIFMALNTSDFEVNEFLGDALLEAYVQLRVRETLQEQGRHDGETAKSVSLTKNFLTNNDFLGRFTIFYKLHSGRNIDRLPSESRILSCSLFNYIESCNLPKELGDIFESVLGFIYVSKGIYTAFELLDKIFLPFICFITSFTEGINVSIVTLFVQSFQEKFRVTPVFKKTENQGKTTMRVMHRNSEIASVSGYNLKRIKEEVSREAYLKIMK